MITKNEVMPLLLEACPSFRERLEEHRTESCEDELLYIDLGVLANHIVSLYKRNEIQELPKVFHAVERLHLEGDEYVKEAATMGLLEGIQNHAEHQGLDPAAFAQYLKPETAKWWNKLNDFWNGDM